VQDADAVRRMLASVVQKVDASAEDLHQLQSQVDVKQTALMSEREMAVDARDHALKCAA